MITFDSSQTTSDTYFVSFTIEWNEYLDSISSGVATGIASDLFSLENNQIAYSDIYELVGDWTAEIVGAPSFGWTIDIQDSFALGTNAGNTTISHTTGIYGVQYDTWDSNGEGNVELTYRVGIPLLQFESDNIAGYSPTSDARLEVSSDSFASGLIIGRVSKGSFTYDLSTTTNDIPFVVVPEANHFSLIAAILTIGIILNRKVRTRR